ncbi:MAG: bifunctional DedA family/phosphatase PAP2 family protein [Gammaproteobacteria bacterium]|nr:MAG: bifunctional DedA family/phosphatase PAP2 family protein [Gammaproteobacteria bacterium]
MEALLADLMQWIEAHPHWAGLVVLVVSALESFLVVGLFVPGTVVMFGIGTMIAAGSMELVPTLVLAAIGAVIGDGTSYFIGRVYHQRLRVMWPFRSYPGMISRGVDFFNQHGGKSLVLARFVGPVRPLVPAVAGMLDMPARRFFLVNCLSAILWAPAYILPGLLFGASLGLAAEIAGRLAVLLIILLALLWFSWWLMRRLSRTLQPHAQAIQLGILDWSRRHSHIEPLAAALLDPEHPEARGMTVLTGLLVLASWAVLTIPFQLTTDSLLGNLDLYLYHWLQSLRSPLGDHLLIVTTEIGDGRVLYSFALLLSLILLARQRWRAAVHWLLTVAIVGLLTWALKHYTAVQRPPLLDNALMSYAFPSAHASLSVAVFGFLAVIMARELRSSWHWIPYSTAVFLVVAIGFSRLYLGVHWLSDVLAGWSLGLVWVALMGIAYRRHPAPAVSTRILAPIALVTLVLITTLHSSLTLDKDLALYRPVAAVPVSLTKSDWLDGGWKLLPAYRDDLKGRHIQPLDIQWSGEQQAIAGRLLASGWHKPRSPDTHSLLGLFNGDATVQDLPVLPQVHRGESQQLLLVHDTDDESRLLTLRLWETEYRLSNGQTPVWVGDVAWLKVEKSYRLFRFLRTDVDFSGALDLFLEYMGSAEIRQVQRPLMHTGSGGISWDGRLLLISEGTGAPAR